MMLTVSAVVTLLVLTLAASQDTDRNVSEALDNIRKSMEKTATAVERLQARLDGTLVCADSYTLIYDSCYRFATDEDETVDWWRAEESCNSRGGHLVDIDTQEEMSRLSQYASKRDFKNLISGYAPGFWTSGNDHWRHDGIYEWGHPGRACFSSAVVGWLALEPDRPHGQLNCVFADASAGMGWRDTSCSRTDLLPLCESEPAIADAN